MMSKQTLTKMYIFVQHIHSLFYNKWFKSYAMYFCGWQYWMATNAMNMTFNKAIHLKHYTYLYHSIINHDVTTLWDEYLVWNLFRTCQLKLYQFFSSVKLYDNLFVKLCSHRIFILYVNTGVYFTSPNLLV